MIPSRVVLPVLVLFILTAASLWQGATGAPAGPNWITGSDGYARALERARADKKPIVLFVFDDDDAPFLETERNFADPALASLLPQLVLVRVDSEARLVHDKFREAFDNAPWVFV